MIAITSFHRAVFLLLITSLLLHIPCLSAFHQSDFKNVYTTFPKSSLRSVCESSTNRDGMKSFNGLRITKLINTALFAELGKAGSSNSGLVASAGSSEVKLALATTSDSELSALLESMPDDEKYSILLQSYCKSILDGKKTQLGSRDATLRKMQSLFLELVQRKNARADESAVQAMIDSSAFFCNVGEVSTALRLSKAGDALRAFGLAIGQLTAPVTSATAAASYSKVEIPYDDREKEVLLASVTAALAAALVGLQAWGFLQPDAQVWGNLYSLLLLGVISLDIFLRKGVDLRIAAAGIERLVLADDERQYHCDGAAFLAGYLLGLPCFCFRPDVLEALKLLREYPDCLDGYKQPLAQRASPQQQAGRGGGAFGVGNLFSSSKEPVTKAATAGGGSAGTTTGSSRTNAVADTLNTMLAPYNAAAAAAARRSSTEELKSERDLALGRVLVWLMAPVAAEQLKYGKTVLSDPRKPQRLLEILQKSGRAAPTSAVDGEAAASTLRFGRDSVPPSAADQRALLEWTYFEACTLVRQYGDLLEEVRLYMDTGTATVGECVLMIEEEMQ